MSIEKKVIEDIGNKSDDFIILKILKKSLVKKYEKENIYSYVAKVKSKLNNKIYAMKRIDLSLLESEIKKYYKNEYEMAKYFLENDFKHKNLYSPVKTFKEEDVIYIITKYIDGKNICDLYNKVNIKIDITRLVKIFDQCLSGLSFMQKKGIIHRDINLDNIMIDSQDRIKIINFSYAIKKDKNKNEIDDKENIKNRKKLFIAPEIEKGKYDEKIDVYALGMVFNFFKSFMEKDIKSNFESRIIKLMIEKEPDKRPSAKEIYKIFKNMYYNLMKACLQSFLFCFKDEILKLETNQPDQTQKEKREKIKKLINDENNKDFKDLISEEPISLEEKFYDNGFEINDFSLKNITNFLLSTIHDDKILNDFYSNINIILTNSYKCSKCNNQIKDTIKLPYITFNADDIEKEKGNIKNLLINFSRNVTKIKGYCENCKNIVYKDIYPINVKYSKCIIILIEKGIDISEIKKSINNLDNFELIEKDENENKTFHKIFKLISIISEDNRSYHYYNRKIDHEQFTKNEKEANKGNETTVYNLNEIEENVIYLFYSLKECNIISFFYYC